MRSWPASLLLLVLAPAVFACGPNYNNAHYRIQDPLPLDFPDFADALFGRKEVTGRWWANVGPELLWADAVFDGKQAAGWIGWSGWRSRSAKDDPFGDGRTKQVAELQRRWREDPAAFRRDWIKALATQELDLPALRRVRDDLDLLAWVRTPAGKVLAADPGWTAVQAYREARDRRNLKRLADLAKGDGPLVPFARCSLARFFTWTAQPLGRARYPWQENRVADHAILGWPQRFGKVTTLVADPDALGPKADEARYLQVFLPVARLLAGDASVPLDPRQAFADLGAYAAREDAAWRHDALGWQAYLLQRDGVLTEGGDEADDFSRMLDLYHRIVADPAAPRPIYEGARNSLHFKYFHAPAALLAEVVDPRLALAYAWHRLRHDRRNDRELGDLGPVLARAEGGLDGMLARLDDPASLAALALGYQRVGRLVAAWKLATRSLQLEDDPAVRYLLGRISCEQDDRAAAREHFDALCETPGDLWKLRDLGLRLGAACEAAGDWHGALHAYGRVDSRWDWHILADHEMPLDELIAFVEGKESIVAVIPRHTYRWVDVKGEKPHDLLPDLRKVIGCRLVRAGLREEAEPYFDDQRRPHLEKLVELEEALAAAPEGHPRAKALYALGAHWYHHGKHLVFFSRVWHQWAFSSWINRNRGWDPKLAGKQAEPWASREKAMVAMTSYAHARALFMEVYAKHPDSPEAPKALYSTGLCDLWLRGGNHLSNCGYWSERAGLRILKYIQPFHRLKEEYPEHPLAHSTWVREKVGDR